MNNVPTERTTDRSRILSQAVVEAALRLKISATELDEILRFNQTTSSRLLNQKYFIPENSKEWELSTHFVRLCHSLLLLVGDDDNLAEDWLTSPNKAFNQRTPISYIKQVDGLIHVCEYLDSHRVAV